MKTKNTEQNTFPAKDKCFLFQDLAVIHELDEGYSELFDEIIHGLEYVRYQMFLCQSR